jgi:type I restriction-modification system DNA methylase subunit
MEKENLRRILSETYQPAFWRTVLTDVFGARDLLQQPRKIALPANELASAAVELGSFETSDERLVGLYQIDLKDNVRIGQNRVGLRSLLRNIYKYDVDAALVVFVQNDKWRLSLISEIRVLDAEGHATEQKTEPKRFTYLLGIGETVRTAVERLDLYRTSDSQLASLIEAFSVEKLNKDFFRDYKVVFENIVTEVNRSIAGGEEARLFSQSLLNRLMFLYFIQKKGWMKFEGKENYLRTVFDRAIANGENFYRDRLYWIFFYGLSNQAESIEIQTNDFLEDRRGNVPYLNGGLFEMEKDGNDEKDKVSISNERFEDVLRLFENYNFTIDESTPFEVQVAVDPEMLGKVFEELVTGRHESGSYYTPRTVVSFMCREALKHALTECDTPEAIAKLVDESDGKSVNNPEQILERLRKLRACDPACGSGAYLLGMLQELLHVREALFAAEKIAPDAQYNWKREIIENSIYGVDMDRFATQIASLRLWLSLAIESDEPKSLPNLKYKIGCGDSLLAPIETVGQGNLHRRALIEQFRARKQEYTDAADHLTKREKDNEIERLRIEIARTLHHLPEPPSDNRITFAEREIERLGELVRARTLALKKDAAEQYKKEQNSLIAQVAEWKAISEVDHYDTGDIFDWSVEFAEVFEDGGFDVVLANPPYVRQEEIDKDIKKKLLTLYSEAMTGKSDLFVAFYARGLQLLKDGGTHVFVCSNSWLDVGYGGKLQGYLLNNSHVAAIYDSAIERQFASADINTIISFIHKQEPDDDDITRFVSLRAPFNEAILDDTKCRVVTKMCSEIWESGSNENNRYEGDKWGGKYLRAPDIYFTIFEKGKDKLKKLGNIAQVKYGQKTGSNEFFLLNRSEQELWNIEEDFLRSFVKSSRECRSMRISQDQIGLKVFSCSLGKEELAGTNALEYIEYGENDNEWIDPNDGVAKPPYLNSSCAVRRIWYDTGIQRPPDFIWFKGFNERFLVVSNEDGAAVGDRLYAVSLNDEYAAYKSEALICLNSTMSQLFTELHGRVNLGEGALDIMTYEVASIPVLLPNLISVVEMPITEREILPVSQEVIQPDRRELDNIIFDALGLTSGERDAVYEAVIDLVSKRLQRAQSITA